MSTPLVYIILVNYKNAHDTIECLKSLEHITYPNAKTIVVEGGSQDDSAKRIVEALPQARVVELQENNGFSYANNRGIEIAIEEGADYVCLLNNDTTVEPDFLKPLVQAIDNNPKAGASSGEIRYHSQPDKVWFSQSKFNPWTGKSSWGKDLEHISEEKTIDWLVGCLMLVKTSAIKKVGMLDERFFMYHEDLDWSLSLRNNGYDLVYAPKSVIYHKISASSSKVSNLHQYYPIRNYYLVIKKQIKGLAQFSALASFWFDFWRIYLGAWRTKNKNQVALLKEILKDIRSDSWGKKDFSSI